MAFNIISFYKSIISFYELDVFFGIIDIFEMFSFTSARIKVTTRIVMECK